jgi:hypothetical protein
MWKEDLENLTRLPVGWDGYKAPPVSRENADAALALLGKFLDVGMPPPQIVPGVDGDLQIEWHIRNLDIEIHIVQPGLVRVWSNNEHFMRDARKIFSGILLKSEEVELLLGDRLEEGKTEAVRRGRKRIQLLKKEILKKYKKVIDILNLKE